MANSPKSDPQPPDRNRFASSSQNALEAGAPEDIDLLELVQTAEDISKRYQEQTLDRVLARSYRAWQNQHAESSKYLGPAFRGRSRLFVPKTRAAVRKNMATAAAALFSTEDVLSVSAEFDDDPVQRATAAVLKADIDYRLTRTNQKSGIPWFLIAMGGCLDGQLTGITVSKQYWEYEEAQVGTQIVDAEEQDDDGNVIAIVQAEMPITQVVKDRPMIELIPVENIGVDPAAPWYDPVQLGAWFWCDYPMHLTDVRARMRSAGKRGENAWLDLPDETLIGARSDDERSGNRRAREGGSDRYEDAKTTGEYDILWIRENFFRVGGVDYHFWSVGKEAFLSKVQTTLEAYPELGGERPYKFGVSSIDTHRVFPMPPVESWYPLQIELNDIANLRLDTMKRSIAPLPTVKRGTNVDLTTLMRRGQPDTIIQVNSQDDIQFHNTPPPPGQAYTESNVTNALFDELAGVYSTSSVQSNRSLNETVGGMRLMAGASNAVSEFDLRIWIETWVEPVLRQIVHLVRHNESDEVLLRLAGSKAQLSRNFPGVAPTLDDFASTEVSLRVNVGIGASDPMQKLQKLQMALNMLLPMMPVFEQQGIKLSAKDVIEEVMGGAGFRDGKRFFEFGDPPPKQPPPGMLELQEKMKLEREKLQAGRDKTALEIQAKRDKTEADNEAKIEVAAMRSKTDITKTAIDVSHKREAAQQNRLVDIMRAATGGRQAAQAQPAAAASDEQAEGGMPPAAAPPQQAASAADHSAMRDQLIAETLFNQLRQFADQMQMVGQMVQHLDAKISAPAEIVRDADNRPVAVRKGGQLRMIERGSDGMITGTEPMPGS